MAGCSIIGYVHGNPYKYLHPTDSEGNICGHGKFSDRPYLMYFDLIQCGMMGLKIIKTGCPTPQVCVKECVSTNYVFTETIAYELSARRRLVQHRKKMVCKYHINPVTTKIGIRQLVLKEKCAAYYVKSTPVVGRCIPSILLDVTGTIKKLVTDGKVAITRADGTEVTLVDLDKSSGFLAKYFSYIQSGFVVFKDLVQSWRFLVVGTVMTVLLAMIWMVLMRWLSGVIIWFSILGVFVAGGVGTYYSFTKYMKLKDVDVTVAHGISESFSSNWDFVISSKDTWLAFGIILILIMVILLLILLCTCSKIRMAIALIKECSRAMGHMFSVLFWPLIPFAMLIAFCAYWLASMVFISSMSRSEFYSTTNKTNDGVNYMLDRIPCKPNDLSEENNICEFVKYGGTEYVTYMQVFMCVMLFWIINFIIALNEVVVSGSFSSYYWAFHKPKDIPNFPVAASCWRAFRYHVGSIAFGSLIITIVQVIRVILETIENRVKGAENAAAKFVLKCFTWCFWCLEKFLKQLSSTAYVMMAMHGTNFCVSAKNGLKLRINNVVGSIVVESTSSFMIFICKFLLTVTVFFVSSAWFQGDIPILKRDIPDLNSYFSPVICLTITSFIIVSIFLNIYNMGVSTLFLCFLRDQEINDGSEAKPYYMTKSLEEHFC
ncbi:choline transporter-like protein 4 isoform X2 [Gigantopelta aegis]|nr:choline transporter-like protein 4 isoform X2 [Gigantopelta aegis]